MWQITRSTVCESLVNMIPVKRLGFLLSAIVAILCFTFVYVHLSGNNVKEEMKNYHIVRESQDFIEKMVNITTSTTTSTSCVETQAATKFIIALNYWEQLNMAMHNLFGLVNLAVAWDGVVVKPFTMNSRLYGLPSLCADEHWSTNVSMLSLSWLYNEKRLDKLSCVNNRRRFYRFDQFLSTANRQVILIHYVFYKEAHELSVLKDKDTNNNYLYKRLISDEIFECNGFKTIDKIGNDVLKSLNKEVHDFNYFRLLKHVCVNGTLETNSQMLATRTGIANYDYLTIIILNWRGIVKKSTNHVSAKGSHRIIRQFIHLPEYQKQHPKILYPSESVLYFASLFVKNFSRGAEFIAVHIRSEKLGQRADRIPNYIALCLAKTIKFLNELKTSSRQNMKIVLITDYSIHGSDSCRDCKGAKGTRRTLAENNLSPISFDPILFGAPTDSGFVSLVELNTLVHAKYLILVGGGAFQKQAMMQFRSPAPNHRGNMKEELYKVCWDDTIQLQKMKTKQ